MAGLQSIFKNGRFIKTSHMIFKNVLVKQSCRANHILSPGLFSFKNKNYVRKLKVIYNAHLQYAYRLSSSISNELNESSEPKINKEVSTVKQSQEVAFAEPETLTTDLSEKNDSINKDDVIDESMLPPVPAESSSDLTNIDYLSRGLTEPTLTDLGLCSSWWPTGWVQKALEICHLDLNLPWWESVAIVALGVRMLTLPFNVLAKRRVNHFRNHSPQIQEFQKRIQEANMSGNYYEAAKAYQENVDYMKENNVQLKAHFMPMIVQSVVFLVLYWALRGVSTLPLESLKSGGLWWFTDLTIADPYYILPATVSGLLYFILRSGVDSGITSSMNTFAARLTYLVIPLLIFPFIIFSPALIQIYWVLSNILILIFTILLKIPALSKVLKIPRVVPHPIKIVKNQKRVNFLEEIRQNVKNYKMHRAIMEREQLSAMNFQKAGTLPTRRTFDRDPTKKNIHTKNNS